MLKPCFGKSFSTCDIMAHITFMGTIRKHEYTKIFFLIYHPQREAGGSKKRGEVGGICSP